MIDDSFVQPVKNVIEVSDDELEDLWGGKHAIPVD